MEVHLDSQDQPRGQGKAVGKRRQQEAAFLICLLINPVYRGSRPSIDASVQQRPARAKATRGPKRVQRGKTQVHEGQRSRRVA
jgi:hypothetical protein